LIVALHSFQKVGLAWDVHPSAVVEVVMIGLPSLHQGLPLDYGNAGIELLVEDVEVVKGVEYSVDVDGHLVAVGERNAVVVAVVVAAWPVAAVALPVVEDVADVGGAFVVDVGVAALARVVVGVFVALGAVVSAVPASKVEGVHEDVTCEMVRTVRTDFVDAEKVVPAYRGSSLS
jgi:hypothetical protein